MSAFVDLKALAPQGSQKNLEENSNDDSNGTRDQKKWDWFAIGICIGMALLAILSLVSISTYAQKTNGKVWQFSVHAYQGPVRNLALSGPFLGKVRVDGTSTEISNSAKDNNKQSYCDNKPDTIKPELMHSCYMMRIPAMYIGKIHSSWSVLGAQSVSLLMKHVSLISFAFSAFILSDCYVRLKYYPMWTKWIRTGILCVAIVACLIAIVLDLTPGPKMHTYENGIQTYAIGSVSTGMFFWIVTLLVICSSQIDEVTDTDWHKHVNLNMSFLVLLLLPLFMILGLLDHKKPVVDVHIQLIFFSSIFFAVLDIFQMRVMPVLEDLTVQGGGIKTEDFPILSRQLHFIKIFVVLACILCKLFVFVPTLDMVGRYYISDSSSFSWAMLACQIALFAGTGVVDLAHIILWENMVVYSALRTLVVWAIIATSIGATFLFPIITA